MQGVIGRVWPHLPWSAVIGPSEAWRHEAFGRWAARELEGENWDVIHCWSGVSEELLSSPRIRAGCCILMRGSAHIAVQDRLLAEEEVRTGVASGRPGAWMIARERREYALAGRVMVLSEFARTSFLSEAFPDTRLLVTPLGVDVRAFVAPDAVVAARARRIRERRPVRVLYVGTLSARKGLTDLVEIARRLSGSAFVFQLVGPATPETAACLSHAGPNITWTGKVDQSRLPDVYHQADLFLFPTIEDGFGMVLTQAKAAGLPILCTTNCAGPDLVTEGRDGWVLPIRSPEAFEDRLRWCDANRENLAAMVEAVAKHDRAFDWADVASAFVANARECLETSDSRECHA
jgi:glycosyltransferase involved in cell wall biosynthesis